MTVAKRHQISVPFWLMIAFLITWGIGYLMLSSALTRLHALDPPGFLSVLLTVLYEIAKAITIGSSAGLLLKYLLPDLRAEAGQATMLDCGISRLYRTRVDARDAFKNAIRDSRTRQVCIAGISLRDFFYDSGMLKDVWLAIKDRMVREDASKVPLDRRLHVRLLLLDPLSSEGYHRYQIERPFLEHGLRDDVPVAVQTVLAFREKLTTSAHEVLQVHLHR